MNVNDSNPHRGVVLAATACMLVSAVLAVLGPPALTPVHAQAPPASSIHVAPGVVRPGETPDEADMTRRPSGIDAEFVDKAGIIGKTASQASELALDRSSNPHL